MAGLLTRGLVAGAMVLSLAAAGIGATPPAASGPQADAGEPPAESAAPEAALAGAGEAELADRLDRLFRREMEAAGIPGAVLVVVRDGGQIVERGFGFADVTGGRRVDPATTVFRVGSISKTLTAIAVLRLAEAGSLDLDRDVNEILGRTVVPRGPGGPVTPFHLLTHTAGFDETLFGQHVHPDDWAPLAAYFRARPPRRFHPPGELIAYNDQGTALAGLVLEAVTGEPFAEHVDRAVLEPLGMSSTTFRQVDIPAEIAARRARAYDRVDGRYVAYDHDALLTAPAAGLMTTGADMARLLRFLLSEEAQAADAATARVLAPAGRQRLKRTQFTHHPSMPGRAFGLAEGRAGGRRVLYKDGQASGFHARLYLVPGTRLGFFFAINRSILDRGWHFNRASRLRHRVTATVVEWLSERSSGSLPISRPTGATASPSLRTPEPSGRPDPPSAEELAGTYRTVVGSRDTLEKLLFLGQEIRVRDAGEGRVEIGSGVWSPAGGLLFRSENGRHAAFRETPSGEITHLFLGAGAYERVPFHSTARFTLGALIALMILAGALLVGIAVRGRRSDAGRRRSGARRVAGRALTLATALHLAFPVVFGWLFLRTDPQRFFHGVPPALQLSLVLPVLGVGLTSLAAVGIVVAAWRQEGGWPPGLTALVVVNVAVSLLLHHWCLLGFRF